MMIRRVLSLCLSAALLLTLAACGSSPAPAPAAEGAAAAAQTSSAEATDPNTAAGEAAGSEAAEPGKAYAPREKEVLLRRTIWGQRLPTSLQDEVIHSRIFDLVTESVYDEFGELQGEKTTPVYPNIARLYIFDDGVSTEKSELSYVYDDAGKLISVSGADKRSGNGLHCHTDYSFEDGHIVHAETILEEEQRVLDETFYEYGPNGQAAKQRTITYGTLLMGWLKTPEENSYAFNPEGYCTRWQHIAGEAGFDVRYTWDADGNNTSVQITDTSGGELSAELVYEDGRLTAVHRTRSGVQQEYAYSYEGDRLTALSYEEEGKQLRIDLVYNADGFPAEARWNDNGKTSVTTYTYSVEDGGDIRVMRSGGTEYPNIFSGWMSADSVDWDGTPWLTSRYEVKPVFDNLAFPFHYCIRAIETTESYDYGPISYKAEIDGAEPVTAVDAYYPVLPESLCGVPLPSASGDSRLLRVRMRNMDFYVVREFYYDELGNCVGSREYFDTEPHNGYDVMERDEQGRATKVGLFGWKEKTPRRTIEYSYEEDGRVLRMTETTENGDAFESVGRLEDYSIADWLRRTPEACAGGGCTLKLDDDGLIVSAARSDGSEFTYTYIPETYADGTLKALSVETSGDPFSITKLSFDEEGNLASYLSTAYRLPGPYFEYEYASP